MSDFNQANDGETRGDETRSQKDPADRAVERAYLRVLFAEKARDYLGDGVRGLGSALFLFGGIAAAHFTSVSTKHPEASTSQMVGMSLAGGVASALSTYTLLPYALGYAGTVVVHELASSGLSEVDLEQKPSQVCEPVSGAFRQPFPSWPYTGPSSP